MRKIKLFIAILFITLSTLTVSVASAKSYVHTGNTESAYTLSEATYDEDTGKLKYQKISYSTNPTTGSGSDVKDSDDYVFIPAKYVHCSGNTVVSFKYKNNGVKKIVLHAEYAAGLTEGGSEYEAGSELVCVDMLSNSWNVTNSKSVDGYDVVTVLFGNYTTGQYDFLLEGFRLYFDYGVTVNSYREFEIFGCEVHEKADNPSFITDPQPTRLSKLTSEDVEIEDGCFTVEDTATVKVRILDYKPEFYKITATFILDNNSQANFKLDGEVVVSGSYKKGKNVVDLPLTKDSYSNLEMEVVAGSKTNVSNLEFELVKKPNVVVNRADSSSKFTITEDENGIKVTYTYKTGWSEFRANIKDFNDEFSTIVMNIELAQPTVIGIKLDGVWLRSHYVYSEPLAAGSHSLTFDLTSFEITESSQFDMWFDPSITNYNGTDGTKTVTFTSFDFIKPENLPDATITVAPKFEFNVGDKDIKASGATSNSGGTISYEYKLVTDSEDKYTSTAPKDAGVYDVRVTSNMTKDYAKTYAYTTLVINKITPEKPSTDVITINYDKNTITYDDSIYVVSSDADFNNVIVSNGNVECGMTLYVKYISSNNYNESESSSLTLTTCGGSVSYTINYTREMTVEAIPTNVEYSKDGIEWVSGNDKKVSLEPGKTYQFRVKATETAFSGEVFVLNVPARPELNEELVLESTTKNSITLKQVEGAEYRLSDTVWQTSPVFEYLKAGDTVTVYMRIKGSNTEFASEEVILEVVVGQMPTVEEQPTPDVESKPEEPTEEGCGGSVIPSIIGVLALLGTAVVLRKKKEN